MQRRWRRRRGRPGRGEAREDHLRRRPQGRRRQEDPGHQGRPRRHRPGPQGSQGPGRGRPQDRQGEPHQGRRREAEEGTGRAGRDRRAEVSGFPADFIRSEKREATRHGSPLSFPPCSAGFPACVRTDSRSAPLDPKIHRGDAEPAEKREEENCPQINAKRTRMEAGITAAPRLHYPSLLYPALAPLLFVSHTGPVCYSRGQPGRSAKPQAADGWPTCVDQTESVSFVPLRGQLLLSWSSPRAPRLRGELFGDRTDGTRNNSFPPVKTPPKICA